MTLELQMLVTLAVVLLPPTAYLGQLTFQHRERKHALLGELLRIEHNPVYRVLADRFDQMMSRFDEVARLVAACRSTFPHANAPHLSAGNGDPV
jgi:hypothetical protein